MLGGFSVLILIEVISIVKSRAIQLSKASSEVTKDALSFYVFRKRIHGPITIAIVMAYVIGFYLLTPEFSTYITFTWLVIMHVFLIRWILTLTFTILIPMIEAMSS